jgi:hypothetical protein
MSNADPIVNNWYQDAETGRSFRVVAIEGDSIEVQYLSGELGEYDNAAWEDSLFLPADPPEDWTEAYDGLELDDLGYSDTDRHGPDVSDITLDDFLDDDR